jgi:membrane associated rhomboid family serine protease
MNGYDSSEDHQPVTWFRGYPVYAAHLIMVGFVVSMFVTTIFTALRIYAPIEWLTFSSDQVLKGQAWRVLTYGLANPPSLQFAFDMAMILWFGREVERFFGRRRFLTLYAGLYLLTPLLFTVVGVWHPMSLAGETGAFALFIAFATLYPEVPLMFNVLAKWLALILVGMLSLMAIAARDGVGLLSLWATTGFAHAFVRHEQGRLTLPSFSLFRRKPKLRLLPDPEPRVRVQTTASASPEKENAMAEVDALLDKIARTGLASLTAKERAKLDAAGAQFTKRRR